MPHPIVEIDELVRLVIGELVETSPGTAVSFALTCRSLEEPTLSSLWKHQSSLIILVKVLPQYTWIEKGFREFLAIEPDPPPKDWDRLRRYASWMHELSINWGGDITNGALSRLSHNSLEGVLCPKLERLDWEIHISWALVPFFRLFLSPHLKHVNLYTRSMYTRAPRYLSGVKEVISCLPASLEGVSITCGPWKGEPLKDAISSLVLRCGPSLRSFGSSTPMSEEAFLHLMQLPNLRCWAPSYAPPRPLLLVNFSSLEELHLDGAAIPWLHVLGNHEEGQLRDGLTPTAAILNANVKETLKLIQCPWNTLVDSTLLSSILLFQNLVTLDVDGNCCIINGTCDFGLTDDDVENLAVTFPSLVRLQLGRACNLNSCRTTISSLLSISTHCLGLTLLEIHFNTRTIVDDIQRLLSEGSGRDKQRCKLRRLPVGSLPLEVPVEDGEDIGIVAKGFADIFPYLKDFSSWCDIFESWKMVAKKLRS